MQKIFDQLGLTVVRQLPSGHTGAKVFLCRNPDDVLLVLKTGGTESAKKEIANNLFGFSQLKKVGADLLLPAPITSGKEGDLCFLTLPWLGNETWGQSAQNGHLQLLTLDKFEQTFRALIANTKHPRENTNEYLQIGKLIDQIWDQSLNTVVFGSSPTMLGYGTYRSPQASVMMLDLTPDNLFETPEGFTFIDPWLQEDYRGNLAVSLGQFSTLCKDVYQLPFGSETEKTLKRILEYGATELKTDLCEMESAWLIGCALQFSLSASVRIHSEPERAHFFAASAQTCWKRSLS